MHHASPSGYGKLQHPRTGSIAAQRSINQMGSLGCVGCEGVSLFQEIMEAHSGYTLKYFYQFLEGFHFQVFTSLFHIYLSNLH
jgi:hypothetical protein